jgi:hypothetical protein
MEGMELVKNLELLSEFESFRDAKNYAKEQRALQVEGDNTVVKVMFADNQLMAEEQLLVHREKPVVMEHEK